MNEEREKLIEYLVGFCSQDFHAIRDLSKEELQEIKKECLENNGTGQ